MDIDELDCELGTCEECGVLDAVYVMYANFPTDETRSNGGRESKKMCSDCAFAAFEGGDWESENQ